MTFAPTAITATSQNGATSARHHARTRGIAGDRAAVTVPDVADDWAMIDRVICRGSQRSDPPRHRRPALAVVLDLSEVPPMPATAPLLALINLLRRISGPNPAITVAAVSPALAAGLTAFPPPDGVTLIDRGGRGWPA